MQEKDEARIPTIRCREFISFGFACWTFHCQYCKTQHVHSAGEGHRVAHCRRTDSPYKHGGYFLAGPE